MSTPNKLRMQLQDLALDDLASTSSILDLPVRGELWRTPPKKDPAPKKMPRNAVYIVQVHFLLKSWTTLDKQTLIWGTSCDCRTMFWQGSCLTWTQQACLQSSGRVSASAAWVGAPAPNKLPGCPCSCDSYVSGKFPQKICCSMLLPISKSPALLCATQSSSTRVGRCSAWPPARSWLACMQTSVLRQAPSQAPSLLMLVDMCLAHANTRQSLPGRHDVLGALQCRAC